MVDHIPYPSIQRLSSARVTITEKIDGTNGVVYVPEDQSLPVLAGSRNEWLTDPKDNFGFLAYVQQHADLFREALGPGYHYGEFYGKGIQRGYDMHYRSWVSFEWWNAQALSSHDIETVPILYQGEWSEEINAGLIEQLKKEGSKLVHWFTKPEGIVIQFEHNRDLRLKKFCENDLIRKKLQQDS